MSYAVDLGRGSKSVRERKDAMSMDEQMKMEYVCKSGNRAEIYLPEKAVPAEYQQFIVEWESWPPTSEDLREYHEEVYAKKIVPLQLRRLEAETGRPHRAFPIAPGLYGFEAERGKHVM
jgi:hypothetical protein